MGVGDEGIARIPHGLPGRLEPAGPDARDRVGEKDLDGAVPHVKPVQVIGILAAPGFFRVRLDVVL